jgi:hypothetical protein
MRAHSHALIAHTDALIAHPRGRDHGVTTSADPADEQRGSGRESAGQDGAACRNRTDDLLITSEPLCRLS